MAFPVTFPSLQPDQQDGARLTLQVLHSALNVVTGTQTAAVAQTANGYYGGANLWLTGPSHTCAELAAITAAHTANDRHITALYLAKRRVDGREPGLLMPCGACSQLLFDLSVYTGRRVTIYSLTDKLDVVNVTPHDELLPHASASRRLQTAGGLATEHAETVHR